MENNRTLEKIKKCLEMAKSKTSNPHEAETALRQAHKLMEMYNLEVGDVLASMAGEHPILAGSEGSPPVWRVRLAQVCADAFGTRIIVSNRRYSAARFIFVGCSAAPELAGYAYQVLVRQLQKARREFLDTQKRCKRSTKVARGDAFANGWLDAVNSKIQSFAGVEDNIAEAIEAYMSKHYPNLESVDLKRRKVKARNEGATDAGYEAGQSAQLHQAVGHQPRARLTVGI
jgi:NifU-like protein involved in Fe-S cluster formation